MDKFERLKKSKYRAPTRRDQKDRGSVVPTRNLLLASLPPQVTHELVSLGQGVRLRAREMIYESGDEIELLYFPIDCVISSLTLLEDGSTVEIAMTGREGLAGITALVGGGKAMHWNRVSVPGTALRISKSAIEAASGKSEVLHLAMLRSYRHWFRQICQRSVCNMRHTLLQRLCVWLLMMNDRVGRPELPLTQDEIASYISVRRAGVSVATSLLQSMQGISTRRGRIVIVDRDTLEQQACECYEIMKRQFHHSSSAGDSEPTR